jgi:hypothetical protein
MASACTWVIQAASLGVFLSFLAWLGAIIASLALSQYVVHPAVQFALSDRKLDRGIEALASLAQAANELGIVAPNWGQLRQRLSRFGGAFATR